MNKPLFVVSRIQHLRHLMRLLPLMTIFFVAECLFLRAFFEGVPVGNLCFTIGFFFILIVGSLYYYDINHGLEIYQNHLVTEFHPFFGKKIINFKEIVDISVADPEMDFSNVKLYLQNGSSFSIYFIDEPKVFYDTVKKQMISFDDQDQIAA